MSPNCWPEEFFHYYMSVFGQKIYTLLLLLTCQWICVILLEQIHNIIKCCIFNIFFVCALLEFLAEKYAKESFPNYRTSVVKKKSFSSHYVMRYGFTEGSVSPEHSFCQCIFNWSYYFCLIDWFCFSPSSATLTWSFLENGSAPHCPSWSKPSANTTWQNRSPSKCWTRRRWVSPRFSAPDPPVGWRRQSVSLWPADLWCHGLPPPPLRQWRAKRRSPSWT